MPRSPDRPALPRLRHRRDLQSLLYLALAPALAAWQWRHGFWWPAYLALLFLTLGIGVIHHNHTHLRMWRGPGARLANRATDFWITALQGHPTFVFWPAHVGNHHRYRHGPHDAARTYRFGGDTNHLAGYLTHPFQALRALFPLFLEWLGRMRRRRPGVWRYCMAQYALWLGLWAGLLALDPAKALLFVILPQLHGLHWLLATNYLQHAHADGGPDAASRLAYARNFEGWVNPLLFNIGLHTAHHEHPRAHWTELARLHRDVYRDRVAPGLNERGLAPYMLRVFVLGSVVPGLRSRPRMAPEHVR